MHRLTSLRQTLHRQVLMYAVEIDGESIGYLSTKDILDLKIDLKKDILLSDEQFALIKAKAQYSEYYYAALNYSTKRLKSQAEVIRRLVSVGCNVKDARLIVEQLILLGIVDDFKLAQAYAHDLRLSKPVSAKMIEVKLRAKGISGEVINRVLAESKVDDQLSLKQLVERKAKQSAYRNNQPKLFRYLISQGYDFDQIVSLIGKPGKS